MILELYDRRCAQQYVGVSSDENKLAMPEFKALWSRINSKSVYVVNFDTEELIRKSIAALDSKLNVPKIYFRVESGVMEQIKSKDDLLTAPLYT